MGWIETLGELSQIVRAQILVCDTQQPETFLAQFHHLVEAYGKWNNTHG